MREVSKTVGRQPQVFGAGHLYQRTFTLIECLAIVIKTGYVLLADCQDLLSAISKEHTSLLKKFTDGSCPGAAAQDSPTFGVRIAGGNRSTDLFRLLCGAIICRDRATGEDEDIGRKIALDDPSNHKDFYSLSRGHIAQKYDC